MKRCGAITKSGKPCRNGWGCPHHRGHGNNTYIATQQMREKNRGPIQDQLFGKFDLTEDEIRNGKKGVAMVRALLSKTNNTISICGCEGNGE